MAERGIGQAEPRLSDSKRLLAILILLTCTLQQAGAGPATAAKGPHQDGRAILEDAKKYGNCVVASVFSFIYPQSLPPRSEFELKTSCRSQSEAFKCIKERSRGSLPLIRRGLMTVVATRSRQNKRICANTSSEQSRNFVEASKCLMEKRYQAMRTNEALLVQSLFEIARRNYNDSAAELKQICCAFFNFKANFRTQLGDECSQHKQAAGELLESIVTDDTTLLCDDDEKLAKLCPKVEPLGVKADPNFKFAPGRTGASLALYLLGTLGESADQVPEL